MRLALPGMILIMCLAASAAWADGPVTTEAGAKDLPPAAVAPPLDDASPPDSGEKTIIRQGPCGPTRASANGKVDQSIHGVIEVGAGTGGYREVNAAACKPFGDNGSIAVGISDSQGHWWRGR